MSTNLHRIEQPHESAASNGQDLGHALVHLQIRTTPDGLPVVGHDRVLHHPNDSDGIVAR